MSVASKNLFAYLGNDDDGEEQNTAPVKTVDKKVTGTAKRNVEPQAPVRGSGGNRRGGPGGNEGAFRDRGAGSDRNYDRGTDEATPRGPRGGAGARVRGGRGSRNPRERDDRTSRHGGQGGSEKQAAQSWGATEGEAELKDEQAGDAIAKTEQKEALAEDAAGEEPAEPEDKSVSYADYLVQQAEKKLGLEGLSIRGANEGSKPDKKWANAKTLENEEEDYFAAGSGKKLRERERKVKQTVDFDPRFVEPERTRGGGRGGRGGARGGERGDRGGRGRGEGRGGRGGSSFRGDRGDRGGRGGRENTAPINTKDESAFPSLGGK